MINRVIGMHFGPGGRIADVTERITRGISDNLAESCVGDIGFECIDLLDQDSLDNLSFDEDTFVVLGSSVFTGRIPLPCIKLIDMLRGSGAMMTAFVTYGNTSYGDSLYELYTFAEEQGFKVISAGAFIATHPLYAKVGERRPDADDYEKIKSFANLSAEKVKRLCGCLVEGLKVSPAPLDVKGSMPKEPAKRMLIHPTPNNDCTNCGKCASICPTGAISSEDSSVINTKKCMLCNACTEACPIGARGLFGPFAEASRIATEVMYRKRKEPEWFI